MDIEVALGLVFLALGLVFWALIAVFEKVAGQTAATGATIVGLLFLLVAMDLGFVVGMSGSNIGMFIATVSLILVTWALMIYMAYRSKRSGERKPVLIASKQAGEGGLIQGEYTYHGSNKESWRSHIYPQFACNPTRQYLAQQAWVTGGAYYVLYFSTDSVEATPRIDVSYRKDKNGAQTCFAAESGALENCKNPVRVYIKNTITYHGDILQVNTYMGAALNSNDGPNLVVGPDGAGMTMSFPTSSASTIYAMGSYQWHGE